MRQFTRLGKHNWLFISRNESNRIIHGIEALPPDESSSKPFWYISLSSVFAAKLKDFRLVKQFYYLTIERLSAKMTTFGHSLEYVLANTN